MSTAPSFTPGQFCWYEVATKNAPQAKAFYSKLFGWSGVDVPMDAGGAYTLLQAGGKDVAGLYEITKEQAAQGVPPHWLPYVSVASADKTAERATQLGAQVVMPPFDVMEHGRMAVIVDPQGASFAIWQPKVHKGTAACEDSGMPAWCELATKDVGKAKDFYGKLFGWKLDTKNTHGMEYTEILAGGRPIGGMMSLTKEHGPVPPHWLTYFSVANCDERVAAATKNGGTVLVPPMDIPTVGRFAVLADPSGAGFAIIKLEFSGEHAEKAQAAKAK
ncbi:MAG: VOC family protein [Planctomycetes bacterium]|nr:VOC family protein [Planctomycetota bacterium]